MIVVVSPPPPPSRDDEDEDEEDEEDDAGAIADVADPCWSKLKDLCLVVSSGWDCWWRSEPKVSLHTTISRKAY
jgi:hypothetical protein